MTASTTEGYTDPTHNSKWSSFHPPWREGQEPLAANSLLEDFRLPGVREGRASTKQLVQEAAQGPVVDGFVMATRQHEFGRQVVGRPTQGERFGLHDVVLFEGNALGEPKVDHLFVSSGGGRVAGCAFDNMLHPSAVPFVEIVIGFSCRSLRWPTSYIDGQFGQTTWIGSRRDAAARASCAESLVSVAESRETVDRLIAGVPNKPYWTRK